jgi:predicted O-methyltransferase YrrM
VALTAEQLAVAREALGFMPEDEGIALHQAALDAPAGLPLLEVGAYCGKSAVYLGAAARALGSVLFSVDHHHGSEENQPGCEYHDPALVDPHTGRIDTLPHFRRTLERAGLEDWVVAVVGESTTVAAHWPAELGFIFIDGSHTEAGVQADFAGWTPHLVMRGILAIHDVFTNPGDGGQAPLHAYRRALDGGDYAEVAAQGTLRILRRAG